MTETSAGRRYQVINASDFRMPGGTSNSISEEVRVQSAAGIPTALVHINSTMMRRALPWSAPMQAVTNLPSVDVLTPADTAHTELLVIRHPSTVKDISRFLPGITCTSLLVLANHAATDSDGSVNYDPPEITEALAQRFGVEPEWRPIGPVVRTTLMPYADKISIGPDWINIFSATEPPTPRQSLHFPPTIGRHSRPQPSKWPDRPADIRLAYPMDTEFDVRILGGSSAAEAVLHKRPSNWTVHEFGAVPPAEFLSEIDFWVYFHHPHTLEAYGRAAMEALYSGCVAILPEYMRETFGDAAIYASPAQVRDIVREYAGNPDKFLAQSARGQAFTTTLGPNLHLKRLEELGAKPVPAERSTISTSYTPTIATSDSQPRVLFITSNGAGMGHLTRTLAIARAIENIGAEPVFFSLSQGVPVVREQGYAYEYMGSSAAMQLAAPDWNNYFVRRLEDVLSRIQPQAVIFDGTVPYNGLIEVLRDLGILRVWIRRGMWRSDSPAKSLRRAKFFDLVIEPGEYATDYDCGPTKQDASAQSVRPITLLRPEELLSRSDARRALGIGESAQTILLTLGAGNINSIEDIQQTVLEHVRTQWPGWSVYLTKPPISESIGESSLNVLKTYPLARLAKAFDVAVSAAGYNSFHEWNSMAIPTLWIPNQATSIDDQVARARWAAETGRGYALLPEETGSTATNERLTELLDQLMQQDVRDKMKARMASLNAPDGASMAARLILEGILR